jgi:glycine betaine/proline transport system ATP-binding protein
MTPKLKAEGVFKVYGARSDEALQLARQGIHPREILSRTGQVVAVSDVSFAVGEGEIFTIMGLSGSGKSTLVRCLNRLVEPTAGSIQIDGEQMLKKGPAELRQTRRTKVAMVFQNFALLPHKSVVANVEFGLQLRGEPRQQRRETALKALDQVGLSEWAHRYPDNLSGGMKQRVGLARALANNPDILLMDEPFSALDPLIRADLQVALLRLQREIKKTIIFITHDFHEAVKLSDRIAVMRDGSFVQVGTPHDIVLRPVDGYVENFARELDRSKLLCAGDVAPMRVPLVSEQASKAEALRHVASLDKPHAVVVDADRRPLGFVRRRDIEAGTDGRAVADLPRAAVVSAPASSTLIGLYQACERQVPVAIVDEAGKAIGAVDAGDILLHLSGMAEDNARRSASPRPTHSAPELLEAAQ